MKKRFTACMLACFMIMLVGCSSNKAKGAAQNETITETSFPAGNAGTKSQEKTPTTQKSTVIQEKAPITTDEGQKADENWIADNARLKSAEEKNPENPKAEPSAQTNTPTVSEKRTERSKEPTIATPKPAEKPTEKPEEPKPAELPKQTFDVSPYVSYAKEFALSVGLSLDSTATECWDNPISANPNRSNIKSDIESRLNRYKNDEGFTAVWIWTEKVSDTEYNIYIGYY